ncbi:MAG: hypothetical protein IJ173_06790 [Kiritimatiellae bacterium]|nr:hypothetical protein [Kiritimatiellia bacterium]
MKTKLLLTLILSAVCLSSNAQSVLRRRINTAETLLEPLIPIEEAFELVRTGKGKGYFQIAMRYAQGAELPMDGHAAYKMLCKACDMNYANAILVEGLCDESDLLDERGRSLLGHNPRENVIRAYCGGFVYNGRKDYDLITNEVAFARVMGKYEKARDLGALAATNQIAALNKRLADLRQQEAEAMAKKNAADNNNLRLSAILGEDLHKQAEDEAKSNEALAKLRERETMREDLKKIQEELRKAKERAESNFQINND